MQAIKNWGKEKPYIIRIFAAHLITGVQDMQDEFKTIKLRRFASHKFPLPHLPDWFALYQSPRKIIDQTKAIWSAAYGKDVIQAFSEMLRAIQKSKNLPPNPPSPEDIESIKELLQLVLSESEKGLEEEIAKTPPKSAVVRRMKKLLAETPLESAFYLFVSVPCWTLYRISPTKLYRQARDGKFEALEKLLRLDQIMLHDPVIGRQVMKCRFEHSRNRYRKLITAALEPPKGLKSNKHILLSLLGFISALSQITTRPLTAQDLINLVGAIDTDYKTHYLEQLPEDPRSLARELQPDRNLWRNLLSTDK